MEPEKCEYRESILNLSEEDLISFLVDKGIPKYRGRQIFTWIYRFGKTSFVDMTNIDKALRRKLDDWFYIHRLRIIGINKSKDGTIKFLLKLHDDNTIETVYIPEIRRNTICVSSQVGCAVGCKFCNTGHHGFIRNLMTEEIIAQYLIVRDYLNTNPTQSEESRRVSNIVFMGMGEPLLNHQNILKAVTNLMSDEETGISRRKITISTAGITDILEEVAKELPCRLAISLHAPNDAIRSSIMPINNKYNIESIIMACRKYSEHHGYLKITFEYLLLNGINDSNECASELLKLIRHLNAKVNLLQFNQWDGCSFMPSPPERVIKFAEILGRGGIEAPIRHRRGEDISAACGQLRSQEIIVPSY
ncbi:MAG: 23S rRNA (adenine(2503)-C(2))-methyltransferase RlmN [Holosporales bacterium]|nr:23S rRNA (adenine(2503)-C(2))-methyltransferase RlmN [Holosporales bacterium]